MPLKHCFLILAHSDPKHLARLVDALEPLGDVFIHLDQKASIYDFGGIAERSHVRFTRERHNVSWAGISMVSAILTLLASEEQTGKHYGHVFILTGSDYPIKHHSYISNIMECNPQVEFVKISDVRESPDRYLKLIERKHFREPLIDADSPVAKFVDKAVRKSLSALRIRNDWRPDVVPYRGHTWCALTHSCATYILDFHRKNPWFYEMNKNTFAPDEHYFHTIIGNSEFSINATHQRCQGGLLPMATTHLIDGSLTKWFTDIDWPLVQQSDKLFVRKVRSLDGAALVDLIDQNILEKADPYG